MIPIPQFLIEMTNECRNEYFRLQNKIERIKEVAKEIEKERQNDSILGIKEDGK